MSAWIFDSHAHYDDRRFDEDREEMLDALPGRGVCAVVNAGSDIDSSRRGLSLAERYAYIWAAAGVHPHEAAEAPEDMEDRLRPLLAHARAVAVGEIGLDYHYDFSPRERQKEIFRRQLELAAEWDLPVIVHDREAHADTLDLLRRYKPRGVLHCFTGSVELAREVLALGLYIGLGGAVTFKNARKPAEVAAMVPADRLLLETDAPYMAPEPLRGKRCDSSMIAHTAARIAALRGEEPDALLARARDNACALFGIPEAAVRR